MDDTLNLLLVVITKDKRYLKIALPIKGGMDKTIYDNYKYYREFEVFTQLMSYLPSHIVRDIDYIVEVTEIYSIIERG